MRAWLEGLDQRERVLVYGAAGLLAVLLVYAIAIRPLHTSYESLVSSVEEQRETMQWMQQSAATVRQLRSANPANQTGLGGRSLLSVTDAAARAANLGSALKRVEPEGSDAVRVWLDGAPFDAVVAWLEVMSTRYGAQVDTITLEKAGSPGLVNARLTLQAVLP
jgi:general secretion pathway protein M